MKLPILNVTYLPNLYKHCSNIQLLHIDISNEGIQEDPIFIKDYLDYIREQIYIAVEAFFITNLATRVTSHKETYVVFKSNTEKKILSNCVEALFAEVDQYCDKKVACSYQYMEAMLFQEGLPVKLFRSGKVGEEVNKSELYKKRTIIYHHQKKPRGKQLMTMEEYRKQYDKLKKKNLSKPIDTKKETVTTSSSEEICEYYI